MYISYSSLCEEINLSSTVHLNYHGLLYHVFHGLNKILSSLNKKKVLVIIMIIILIMTLYYL